MSIQCNNNLSRAIAVADFILEDGGHSVSEASKEFKISMTSIRRDLNYLGAEAFYGKLPNEKLKKKYKAVKSTLDRLAKKNQSNSHKAASD